MQEGGCAEPALQHKWGMHSASSASFHAFTFRDLLLTTVSLPYRTDTLPRHGMLGANKFKK